MPGSKITLTDAMLTLFTMYGLQKILDLLQILVPQNLLPKTVDSFLEPFACDEGLIYKDFCESCCYLDELNDEKCPLCGGWLYEGGEPEQKKKKTKAFFIQLPLKKDLDAISRSRFFGRPGIPENSQI